MKEKQNKKTLNEIVPHACLTIKTTGKALMQNIIKIQKRTFASLPILSRLLVHSVHSRSSDQDPEKQRLHVCYMKISS